jgi:hypothetical protein
MHEKTLLLLAALFPLAIQRAAISQNPHLFLSLPEIAHRNAIADREPWARACYEVCTKIGAYVGRRFYPLWMDGKQREGRLSERRFG